MSQPTRARLCLLLALLVFLSGCHPTQPFFFHEDGDLDKYLETATQVEYPDVYEEEDPEVYESLAPFNLRNMQFREYWDVTLEDCINHALANSEVIRSISHIQSFGFSRSGASQLLGAQTVYDPAVSETNASTFAQQVDNNGNRVLSRGAARATQQGVADALAEFDAQPFVSMTYNSTDRARNVGPGNVFNPVAFIARDANFLASLSKRTATGGVFTARQRVAYSQNNVPIGVGRAVPSDWTAILEFEVNQPLLRNAGAQMNRIPIILARTNTDIAQAEFEAQVRNLVMDVENAYWDLHLAYQTVAANSQGRDAALVVWRSAQARTPSIDYGEQVHRAEGQYLRYQAQAEQALSSTFQGQPGLFQRERNLRYLMGISPTDGRLIRPVAPPTMALARFDWQEIVREAIYRSPELREQRWLVTQRELELMSARNQILPDLALTGQYRYVGVGDRLIGANRNGADFLTAPVGSVAFDELTGGQWQEGFFGLQLTPNAVGARRPHALIRNATLNLKRTQARLKQSELVVVGQLSDAISQMNDDHRLIELSWAQLAQSEREVQALEAQRGRGDPQKAERIPELLLDAHDRRARARVEYFQRLTDYNKQIALVHFQKGSLLDYNGVQLAEGPWPDKAYWDAHERARERDASYYLDYGVTAPGVVSQGPVGEGTSQDGTGGDGPMPLGADLGPAVDGGLYPEELPMDEFMPSDMLPAPPALELGEPMFEGPAAMRSDGPMLNSPRAATATDSGVRLAGHQRSASNQAPVEPFAWEDAAAQQAPAPVMSAPASNPASPLGVSRGRNPLR